MTSGTYRLELLPVSIHRVLHETVNNVLPWARQQKVHMRVKCEISVPGLVSADPHRLAQVLANFLR